VKDDFHGARIRSDRHSRRWEQGVERAALAGGIHERERVPLILENVEKSTVQEKPDGRGTAGAEIQVIMVVDS